MLQSETINIGHETVEQILLGGPKPIVTPSTQTARDAHTIKTTSAKPLRSSQAQKPCTIGLWDDTARAQRELF